MRPAYSGVASYKVENMSVADDLHPVIHAGRVAVITGAANGIGKAAAIEFAKCVLQPLSSLILTMLTADLIIHHSS